MAKTRKARLAGAGSRPPTRGSERHARGRYYTPAIACDLICRLAITPGACNVLDPSCGDGEFLVAAAKRLGQLDGARGTKPNDPSSRILQGIEIDGDAAIRAHVRLEEACKAAAQVRYEISHADFFDVGSGKPPFPVSFHAVIGNPPYVRQELIGNKEKVRAHLSSAAVDERSDLYVYFFSRAEQWLAGGGRIGFLTSERYLDTQYGRGLQQFLLDHFKIRAVIAFDKQLFSDALVGTVITILEKDSREKERSEHLALFLRVKRPASIDELEDAIESPRNRPCFDAHGAWDSVLVPQHVLAHVEKWRPYLYAPPVFFELEHSPRLVALGEVATIKRGITSGANRFFYRRDGDFEELEGRYPGLRRYFTPLLKAIGQTDWLRVAPGDTDWFVLDVHSLVEECVVAHQSGKKWTSQGGDPADTVKEWLSANGHGSLVRYIEGAENGGGVTSGGGRSPQANATCAGRPVWFDLGNLLKGGIGFPKEYWSKFICPLVDPDMALDSRVYVVEPRDWQGMDARVDKLKVLAAILNADLSAIFYECQGRVYAGQALDRASCMVYEANKLRAIDPRQLSTASLLAIQARFDAIIAAERVLVPRKTRSTFFEASKRASPSEKSARLEYLALRQALNEAILGAVGLAHRAAEIQASVQQLVDLRRKRGWEDVQVLIER
ncbi:MAG: SAM-dependent DNA methyltransferase [Candidatus Lokiarchaeota archaeon]|nr:SAM-dependent DNA methyltransferase [Candidatus Lokiarchaeota archaeon]